MNIALIVTGGVAAYKAAYLASKLTQTGNSVHTIMTKNATSFVAPLTFESLTNNAVTVEMFDKRASFDVHHVALEQLCDICIVAPATYNIIGKHANGIADDFASTFLAVFDKQVYYAPAMNTKMLQNPILKRNIDFLKTTGVAFIYGQSGHLACGDEGLGRMAEPDEIFDAIFSGNV